MGKWFVSLIVLLSLFISLPLFAGGFVEPALGIKSGSYKTQNNEFLVNRNEGWAKGGVLFIRGGYSGDLLFGGLELGMQIFALEADYGITDSNAGFVGFMPGLVLGLHVPILPIRVWAGAYISAIATSHEEAVVATKWTYAFGGSAFKLGAGWRVISMLSLNIELCHEVYTKVKKEITLLGVELPDEEVDLEDKPSITSVIISISMPVDFWKD